jgi:hypothetical protein
LDSTRVNTSASGVSITATNSGSGIGNTLSFDGFKLGSAVTSSIVATISGNANVTFRGAIINGADFSNGLNIRLTGVTTFNGTNTYTGKTVVYSNATLRVNGSLISPVTVNSNGVIGGSGTISALTNSTGGILEAALNSTWNTAGTLTFATNSIVRVLGTPSGSNPYILVAATSISANTMPILNPSFSGWELAVVGGTNLVLRTTAGGGGDTSAPVITRIGNASINVAWGASYTDAGATATDTVDGSVTVTPTGSVNTAVPGIYTITYNARDAANNNAAAVTRTVTVSAPSSEVGADGLSGILLYAFGANGPSDTVTKPTSVLSGGNLVITAIVRTDNPSKLTVVGQAVTDLANYASGSSIVTVLGSAVGVGQASVPSGCQRQTFTVAQGEDMSKFLRLSATLVP